MPFTPTHVVAILPLWPLRRFLPFVPLAIGSMIPDVSLFFPVVDYAQTHSPTGVFTTCLPLGMSLFLLFETVMRRPLVGLLPIWFQRRLETQPQIPAEPRLVPHLSFYTGAATAVVIGAFTHQIWDAFTHQGRWGTGLIPSLNSVYSIVGYAVPGYKLFQYGSTFVGLPLLAAVAIVSLNRLAPKHVETMTISTKWKVFVVLLVFSIPLAVGLHAIATQSSYHQAFGVTIKLSGAIIAVFCIVYCGLFQVLSKGDTMHSKALNRSRESGKN